MSSKSVIQAGRKLSTMAVSHHSHMAPKVVFSDFATRILPNLSLQQSKKAAETARVAQMTKTMFHNEPPLDPRDYGYRVAPMMEKPPLYTSTVVVEPDSYGTTSTLGKIICAEDCAPAEEFLAAQREWDSLLDMEPTRPHFEYYKEDPYNQFEDSIAAQDLFAYIDSHGDMEEAA